MRRSCYSDIHTQALLSTLFLFLLLLLCEHRLGLVDSPSCQSFKRSSITAIITSTPTNKQPSPSIRLPRKGEEKLHTCGPLWFLLTNLCVFEKGLTRLRWCRGQKSNKTRSETNKKGDRGRVTSRLKRRHYSAAACSSEGCVSLRRFPRICDVAAYPDAQCTIFTATISSHLFQPELRTRNLLNEYTWPCAIVS